MNQPLRFMPLINLQLTRGYAKGVKNILRNKYAHRNPDGTYMEYNESITIVPKEFEKQDEYKKEKQLAQEYVERYQRHLEAKKKLYSLKLPKSNAKSSALTKPSEAKPPCPHTDKEANSAETIKLDRDPFKPEPHQCIFCKYNIKLDYKNVQLLSQFVSPHTGIVYSQQATGLCYFKQEELEKTVFKAKRLGLMPFFYKETVFLNDPKLFDPYDDNLKRIPNNYDRRLLTADDAENEARKSRIRTARETAK